MPNDPQSSRARKQLRTRDAIPLDEVEADFGMKGMLSFLDIPREEASRNLEARRAVDLAREPPMGALPMVNTAQVVDITTRYPNPGVVYDPPRTGLSPIDGTNTNAVTLPSIDENIEAHTPLGPSPMGRQVTAEKSVSDISDFKYSVDIPDVGKRKPFRWTLAQDAHTAAEQNLFAAMMEISRRQGPKQTDGSSLVEASLTDLQKRLRTDHKQIKKLLVSLIEKHAIALDREAEPARQIPARYRVFSFQQINEKRRSLGLLWVVKNRGVRLLSDQFVRQLLTESPMGPSPPGQTHNSSESPMGLEIERPTGNSLEEPMGRTPSHIIIEETSLRTEQKSTSTTDFVTKLRALFDGDCDVQLAERIWKQGRVAAPDITEDELLYFVMSVYQKAKQNPKVHRPQSIVVATIAGHISGGGLNRLREQMGLQQQQADRERDDTIEFWKGIASDPTETENSRIQARSILREYGIVVQ